MDLTPYVEHLRRELAVAAEAGGEDARALAERLTGPLESATRLVLLEALSAAADEITRGLAPGSVDLRLRGLDPGFVVTPPPSDQPDNESAVPQELPPVPDTDEGSTARINLRLPEHIKVRVEEAAGQAGLSVNAWLVRALAAATAPPTDRQTRPAQTTRGQRYTGWVR